MGTLIELASGTLDTLGHLISRPAGQALTLSAPTRPSERPLDVRAAILATRRTTEAVLFYATTQLGAWVTNPDLLDAGAGGADAAESMDEMGVDSVSLNQSERRGGQRREQTVVMTERMRRGLTGEISGELKAVLEKARGLLAKSQQTAADKQTPVDITNVLLSFLNHRVIGST